MEIHSNESAVIQWGPNYHSGSLGEKAWHKYLHTQKTADIFLMYKLSTKLTPSEDSMLGLQ